MKKKILVVMTIGLIMVVLATIYIISSYNIKRNEEKIENNENKVSLLEVKEQFENDIKELKDGKYSNLVCKDFSISIESVESLHNIEIKKDTSYRDRTFIENFEIMKKVIDDFFDEDFDKSYIEADFEVGEGETIYVKYDDIEDICVEEKFNTSKADFLFGNNTSEGGYMVQIAENLKHAWFSKNEFGTIIPSTKKYKQYIYYLSGNRQCDDFKLKLKDCDINLSEMQDKVLDYVNENFPLPKIDTVDYIIGDARIIENGDYEGICFILRRMYKGVPFEYGSNGAEGLYVDELDHDAAEIDYAVSSYPDTMLSFGSCDGTIVEIENIDTMLSLGDALKVLSNEIGDNSVYDVNGIELVYRNQEIPEERENELNDILVPKWKVIAFNENDNKYTIFYIDVVSAEVTERFEYYYE